MSIIVVSDVHLGGYGNYKPYLAEFCGFLEWIKDLPSDGQSMTAQCEEGSEKTIKIKPPEKLILLGDLMDIWDPREQDRSNIIKDLTKPFSLFHEIKCEKIYVTGNHDEDVEEVAKKLSFFGWPDDYKFCIVGRHYPPGEKIREGVKVGGSRYSFLHGHQYDKEQITYTISQILKTRFDPLDFLQDLANISFTKVISPAIASALFVLFILFIALWNKESFFADTIKEIIGFVFGAILAIFLFRYYRSSRELEKQRNISGWFARSFLVSFVILIAVLVFGAVYNQNIFLYFFSLISLILSYLVFVSVFPKIITFSMKEFYNKFRKSKDKSIEQVIKEDYYNLNKDTINADVVVFGHTHKAGTYLQKPDDPIKFLFNWDEIPENNKQLKDFLKENFNIDCTKICNIEKIGDVKAIKVSAEKNVILLGLDDEKTRLNLKIDDGRTDEFVAKKEKGKLNIYNKLKLFVNTGCWVNEKDRPVNTFAYIDDSGIYLLRWTCKGIYTLQSYYN